MRKGSHHSAESCAKMSVSRKGRKLTLESRKKMSAVRMGNKNGLGARKSPEEIEALRQRIPRTEEGSKS